MKKRKTLIAVAIIPVVILLDQWTKMMVLDSFYLGESISVIPGWFHLTYVQNTGAAFGILRDADPMFRVPFFLIVPLIALGVIGYVFKSLPDKSIFMSTALSLVMGGAVGNLIDRALLGYVVDFLDFFYKTHHFPAFNVADSAICVGVGMMMFDLFVNQGKQGETNASTTA